MILVTGYKGFIGQELTPLIEEEWVGIDVREGMNLLTCPLPEVDTIIHLAAQSSVESSWSDPVHDSDNLKMTVRLAHHYPNSKIIYAQSAASVDQSSPYGFSKWAAGEYLKRFHENTVHLVFPNIYGEGSRSVVDIFKETDPVTVYGDGLSVRDYVHVGDLIQGILKAVHWDAGEYEMGSGKATTVLELAKGKQKVFAPARKEARESVLRNTTPDWEPSTDVMEYLYA